MCLSLSLSRIGGDDEDELLGNADDGEAHGQQHGSDGEAIDIGSDDDIDGEDIDIGSDDGDDGDWSGGDVDDDHDDDGSTKVSGRGKKRKHGGGVRGTPFASLEDYEHLMNDDNVDNGKIKKLKGKDKDRNKNKAMKNDKSKKRKKSS